MCVCVGGTSFEDFFETNRWELFGRTISKECRPVMFTIILQQLSVEIPSRQRAAILFEETFIIHRQFTVCSFTLGYNSSSLRFNLQIIFQCTAAIPSSSFSFPIADIFVSHFRAHGDATTVSISIQMAFYLLRINFRARG